MSNLMTVATHRIARLVRHTEPLPTQQATFIGVATLSTSRPDFRGPYARPVSAELQIDERGRVTVTSLYLAPVKVGSVTCTISQLPKTGIGTYVAGHLHLTIGLHVGIDVLRGAQDSEIMLELTTESPGSAATADGRLTVAGTATFHGGYFGGRLATMEVSGAIATAAGALPVNSVADLRPSRMMAAAPRGRMVAHARPNRAVA
jgi:hypothetical protein